jgi:hypothetical protein
MTREENPFRCCLWCGKEIGAFRQDNANFCRFTNCADKFRRGYENNPGGYREACERNRLKPIKDARLAQVDRRAQRRRDSEMLHLCKLGEFVDKEGNPLCSNKFMGPPNWKFCPGTNHQVRYNSIKAQLKKVNQRIELRKQLGLRPENNGSNSN